MRGFVGTIVFHDEKVLLVQDRDYFTGEPLWTLPSGAIEADESRAVAAAREIAEESGCTINPSELEPIATSEVRQDGRRLSYSWNFTATAADPHLAPADPDETVDDARWFERDEAAELLTRHRYDPIREPVLRFLAGTAACTGSSSSPARSTADRNSPGRRPNSPADRYRMRFGRVLPAETHPILA